MFGNQKLKLFSRSAPPEIVLPPDADRDGQVQANLPPSAPSANLEEVFTLFERDVARIANFLKDGIVEARDKTDLSRARLNGVHDAIAVLAEASGVVKDEVAQIDQAAQELSVAAEEITHTVIEVQNRAKSAILSVDESAHDVEGLASAVSEIDTILGSIGEIAQRTNLLALNATIEAARAGDAGRGFAVVASEVKALSVGAAQAVAAIRQRMDGLQAASDRAISGMRKIAGDITEVGPICDVIARAAGNQRHTVLDLTQRITEARSAVEGMNTSVGSIRAMSDEARDISTLAGQLNQKAVHAAQNLERRVVTILRTTPVADRRQSERFPIDLAIRIKEGTGAIACRSFDVSLGGLLIRPQEGLHLRVGTRYQADISRIGAVGLKIVNTTAMGIHCQFLDLDAGAAARLEACIAEFQRQHHPLIERAQNVARDIGLAIGADIEAGRLSVASVFDPDYLRVPETLPPQFTTRYLERFEAILPEILNRPLRSDPSLAFCIAADRNGYIPVHNTAFSLPQRPGDEAWNTAHARNRRFFDDRTGLLAGRLARPYLIQTYLRDMGNGVMVVMKEIDAPIIIAGRQWGGVRMGYKAG